MIKDLSFFLFHFKLFILQHLRANRRTEHVFLSIYVYSSLFSRESFLFSFLLLSSWQLMAKTKEEPGPPPSLSLPISAPEMPALGRIFPCYYYSCKSSPNIFRR